MFPFFSELRSRFKLPGGRESYSASLLDGKFFHVEGHDGIVLLSPSQIFFKAGKKIYQISGENLVVARLESKTLSVSGNIFSFGVKND